MSYATTLSAGGPAKVVDATLLIDGIPILFGTRAGLEHPLGASVQNPPASLVSVAGIVAGSVSLDGSQLDYDRLLVPPTSVSVKLHASPSWDGYFERRRSKNLAVLTSSVDATATSFSTTTATGWGSIAYVDRETVAVGASSSTGMTSLTRNYCALPMTRKASHEKGAVVSGSPRFLLGRAAEFRLWLDATQSYIYSYLYLASSPKRNTETGEWEVEFDSAIRSFDRKLYTGWRGARAGTVNQYDLANITESSREFFASDGDYQGHLLFDVEGGRYLLAKYVEPDAVAGRLITDPRSWRGAVGAYDSETFGNTVRRVGDVSSLPGGSGPLRSVLYAMLSDRGDGTNHATYDALPGKSRSGDGTGNLADDTEGEMRMGAAVPAALVDVEGIEQADNIATAGWSVVIGASGGEESLLDLMEEAAWIRGGYWAFNDDGKLSFFLFDGTYADSAISATLGQRDILLDGPLVSVDDESEIRHTYDVSCNASLSGFRSTVSAIYLAERETFRDINGTSKIERHRLVLEAAGYDPAVVVVGTGARAGTAESLRLSIDRLFARTAKGLRRYTLALPWRYHTIRPGQRVAVTHPYLIDFAGSSLTGQVFEVSGVQLLYGEGVEITIQEVWDAYLVSPTTEISSYSSDTREITCKVTGIFGNFISTTCKPGLFFADGWRVRGLRASGSVGTGTARTWSVAWTGTVAAVTDDTITLAASPSATPSANDIVVQDLFASSDTMNTNAAQGASQHKYAHQGNSSTLMLDASKLHEWG